MTATAPDPALAATERFLRALDAGDVAAASAAVGPDVPADAMAPDRLRDVWGQLVGHLGPPP